MIIGFIDRESPVGRLYEQFKEGSVFYRIATFYTVDKLTSTLKKAGFRDFNFTQTIFHPLADIKSIETVKEGNGEGSFVVIRSEK